MSKFFFGYGSLVNRATHTYPQAQPARVLGWRRSWRHTDLRPVAYLTAEPAPEAQIAGLIAEVPGDDWRALDEREGAYRRHPLAPETVLHPVPHALDIQIYAVPPSAAAAPSVRHPILLSYLDVVVQGFLQVFGEAGVADFFATTEGWDAPVLNDRAAPRYPRHQPLSPAERALVDARLAGVGARIVSG